MNLLFMSHPHRDYIALKVLWSRNFMCFQLVNCSTVRSFMIKPTLLSTTKPTYPGTQPTNYRVLSKNISRRHFEHVIQGILNDFRTIFDFITTLFRIWYLCRIKKYCWYVCPLDCHMSLALLYLFQWVLLL